MASRKSIYLLLSFLAMTSAFTVSHVHGNGRKLFGGYRIVPKVCQPTNPSRTKSNEPAICMFNYECTRRNGEVVGACMDGFLFGACCQLPSKEATATDGNGNANVLDKSPSTENLLNLHEIDHVPDVPILLNPDGTPVGLTVSASGSTTKTGTSGPSNHFIGSTGYYTKVSTLSPIPSTFNGDAAQNAEKTQLSQHQIDELQDHFPALLGQQEVVDDLTLPGLLAHSESNNDIQEHQDPVAVSPVSTLLNPNQVLQIVDPVDQLPALFSQGVGTNNHSSAETILLNENGTLLNESNNPDEVFKPSEAPTETSSTQWVRFPEQTVAEGKKPTTKLPIYTQMYANTQKLESLEAESQPMYPKFPEKVSTIDVTTPVSTTVSDNDDLVRVPTITYDVQSGNKKNDELDREEIAINHIISMLNASTPSTVATKLTTPSLQNTWVSIDEKVKPSTLKGSSSRPAGPSTTTESFPYTFFRPEQSSTYYHYNTFSTSLGPSSSNTYSSRPPSSSLSTEPQGTFASNSPYTTRPSTNPPAPTVIVLGPLGTEFTTITTPQKAQTRPGFKPASGYSSTTKPPQKPSNGTKKPSVSTTITHNISTVISTGNSTSNNNHVVSTSYISVNVKDGTSTKPSVNQEPETGAVVVENYTKKPGTIWTTISSWTKPAFHLKPNQNATFSWPSDEDPAMSTLVFKETTIESTPELLKTTTAAPPCPEEESTSTAEDIIIFPPVRHPNPNITLPISQQEKPLIVESFNSSYPGLEILSEYDIPTPTFIEDDVLTNKVDTFVNKIVQSLQGNFQDLKDIVYNRRNVTVTTPSPVTKPPTTKKPPIRRPTAKPPASTTKRPSGAATPSRRPTRPAQKPTARPPTQKPTTPKVTVTTKKPVTTTKRPKPTRRVTTTTTSTTEATVQADVTTSSTVTESATPAHHTVPSDFRTQCGVRPLIKKGRIVGGKASRFGEWPWQVLIREATWLGLFTKNKCGGVLISDRYVVTAAHCQPDFLASLVAVLGDYDISGEREGESKRSVTRNIRRIIVNRGYNPLTYENDLALLELESPVEFDSHIVPICMPEEGEDIIGRMATVTGWGRQKYNGAVPSLLQEVQVPLMENSVCQEMFITAGYKKQILDSFLCAGYANGQKDSCEGDSGGPLVVERPDGRWALVGTVSHGIKCAAPYLPGVYIRTTYFKPWLKQIAGI